MNGRRQTDEGGRMLQRIVALLFALADLAESASHPSHAVRQLVLWVLYPAEAVARNLVLEAYGPVELATPRTIFSDDGPDDALRLAASLRVLAMMLAALETDWFEDCRGGWFAAEQVGLMFAGAGFRSGSVLGAPAWPFPDTS